MRESPEPDEHETVGAYALGILDDAEATAFETHLAGCEWCTRQLEELAALEPVLAALAGPPGTGTPETAEPFAAKPGPLMVDALVGVVAERRAAKRRRTLYLAGAAAALIVGGPFAAVATTSAGHDGGSRPPRASAAPARAAFEDMGEKITATDPATGATATVALEAETWGTHAVLRLKNVTGPRKCSLVAVGRNGERETVTSWSVPGRGYGVPGAGTDGAGEPLYVQGGAALGPHQIDRFEIITFDGERLVEVDA